MGKLHFRCPNSTTNFAKEGAIIVVNYNYSKTAAIKVVEEIKKITLKPLWLGVIFLKRKKLRE